jgi:hypothetical protein
MQPANWALVKSASEATTPVGLSTVFGGALGPPFTKLPGPPLDAGTAAAWGLTWGFLFGLLACVILPAGFWS